MASREVAQIATGLPEPLVRALEGQTGRHIVSVRPRAGGGASRDGAEVELRATDGGLTTAYLSFDLRRRDDPQRVVNFRREASVLRALSGPHAAAGVAVPRVLAADEDHLALLCEFAPGEANFNRLADPQERLATGQDFMRQLAALHSLDVHALDLDGYADPALAWTDALRGIADRKAAALANGADPQIVFALDWLERHAPPPPERIVLLHGDCGPGNFLYQGGRVTAQLDWELSRYGDPMEDLAMLCIRNLLQSFIPLPDALKAYAAAGGPRIDLDRIRYHRLSNQLGFMATSQVGRGGEAPEPPILGMSMVYQTMHMRIMAEQLAELAGVDLPEVVLPVAPPGPNLRTFEIALKDLRDVIVPRTSDQQASEKAKGLARLVKFWRERERYGALFDAEEVRDIAAAIGGRYSSLADARSALRAAIAARALDDSVCIRLFHARAVRETAVMADAMGALARTRFAPLEA